MRKAQYIWWLLFVGAFLFGHLGRLLWPATILGRINLLDIVVAAAVLVFWRKIKLPKFLVGFIVISLLSFFVGFSLFGFSSQPESLMFLLRLVIYSLFIGVAPQLFQKKSQQILMTLGVLVSLIGLIQLQIFSAIPVSMIASHGFDPHAGRLFATFFDPNFAAVVLVITTLATLNIIFSKYSHQTLLALLIQIYALLLTNSRSGLLALLVALFIFFLMRDKKYVLLLLALSMAAFILSPSLALRIRSAVSLDATSKARFASWETASLIIEESPVIGVGYNNYQWASSSVGRFYNRVGKIALSANASDSSILTLWATVGFFGVVLFSLFWLAETKRKRPVVNSAMAAIIINSWFLNSWLWPFTLFLLALILIDQE